MRSCFCDLVHLIIFCQTPIVFSADYIVIDHSESVVKRVVKMLRLTIGSLVVCASAQFTKLNDANFEHDVQAYSGHTTGDWVILFDQKTQCGSCDLAREVLAETQVTLREERPEINSIVFGEVDLDESQECAKRFRISGAPTVAIFSQGRIYEYDGAYDTDKMLSWIADEYRNHEFRMVPPPPSFADSFFNNFGHVHLAAVIGMVLVAGVCTHFLVFSCKPTKAKIS